MIALVPEVLILCLGTNDLIRNDVALAYIANHLLHLGKNLQMNHGIRHIVSVMLEPLRCAILISYHT